MTPPMMMPKQKPVNPAPLILPTSVSVKPNSVRQLSRNPPRIAKPIPAARMAMNPPHSRRYALGASVSLAADFDMGRLGGEEEQTRRRAESRGNIIRPASN